MAKEPQHCKWLGESGLAYTYIVLRLPCKLQTGQEGNYIFAKRNPEGKWVPVYIGHGDLSVACTPYNPQWDCIVSHGATHFHCHLALPNQARQDEADDLLSRYKNAFAPYGCNIQNTPKPAAQGSSLSGLADLDIELSSLEKQTDSDLGDLDPFKENTDDNSETHPKP